MTFRTARTVVVSLTALLASCTSTPPAGQLALVDSQVHECPKVTLAELSMKESARVKRVVDGDTLVLADGREVRLVGVDTPETKHPRKPVEYFGTEASDFTKSFLEG